MEIEGEDGSKIYINRTGGSKTEFGRGLGFRSDDRSVSRRHISFELCSFDNNQVNPDTQLPRVSFEVLGRNPIWVYGGSEKDVRVFRNSDKGEMSVGDCFCVSAMNPILFTLKRVGFDGGEDNEERVLKEGEGLNRNSSEDKDMMEIVPSSDGELTGDENLGFGPFDASEIDPVKEFGFVVMGHEFDNYPPKQIIRNINNLDWYIEEPKEVSGDDETTTRNRSKRKKSVRGKKNNIENEDDDWTGESEDEKVLISKLGKDKRPRHTKTRSRDSNKPIRDTASTSTTSATTKTIHTNDNDEDDDDEDEDNLGGFIVNEEEEEEKYDEDEDDEEEDYEDDDLISEEEI